jgi:two-component system, cell cycle sensor histidine kinase and response regulator CckA
MVKGTGTLLFVDDEESNLRLFARYLEDRGFQVLTATTAVEALERVTNYPGGIHLIVADIFLPKRLKLVKGQIQEFSMNGLQLAGRIRWLRPDTPILFVSGYSEAAIEEVGGLPPDAAFLKKPFEAVDLFWKVQEVLKATKPT